VRQHCKIQIASAPMGSRFVILLKLLSRMQLYAHSTTLSDATANPGMQNAKEIEEST
jgi:hypothetical protein